jgi:hypothetical protein
MRAKQAINKEKKKILPRRGDLERRRAGGDRNRGRRRPLLLASLATHEPLRLDLAGSEDSDGARALVRGGNRRQEGRHTVRTGG